MVELILELGIVFGIIFLIVLYAYTYWNPDIDTEPYMDRRLNRLKSRGKLWEYGRLSGDEKKELDRYMQQFLTDEQLHEHYDEGKDGKLIPKPPEPPEARMVRNGITVRCPAPYEPKFSDLSRQQSAELANKIREDRRQQEKPVFPPDEVWNEDGRQVFEDENPAAFLFSSSKKTSTTIKSDNAKLNMDNATIKGDNNRITGNNLVIRGDNLRLNVNNSNIKGDNIRLTGNNNKIKGDNARIDGRNNKFLGGSNVRFV